MGVIHADLTNAALPGHEIQPTVSDMTKIAAPRRNPAERQGGAHSATFLISVTLEPHFLVNSGEKHIEKIDASPPKPRRRETPSIVVEFVSRGRTNLQRDYETKRDEYLAVGVQDYWIFDRFDRTLTVWMPGKSRPRRRTIKEGQVHRTPLLPGFEVPLDRLLELADAWQDE